MAAAVEKKDIPAESQTTVSVENGTTVAFTEEEERRIVRKIDTYVLPLMCITFFLQYMDKQSLSYASVFDLITDLNLTGSQYSWCSSIFYIGQLVAEYPFIYLMSRLPLTKFVGGTIVCWGIVCMCLAAPKNFAGFAAVRFLLGFCEGAVSPAFVTLSSIWYKKREHPMRVGLWITMNGLAQVVGALLMYGIGRNTSLSLAPWRTLFIIVGAITFAGGIAFYLLMPRGPEDAWFLTPREKEVLTARLAGDHEGGDKTYFSVEQLKESALDYRTWFTLLFGVLVTTNSLVLTFSSLVIKNIGYNKYQTMLYTAPSGAVQILFIWLGVLGCTLLPTRRCLVVLILILPPLAGNVLLLKLPVTAGWGLIVASWISCCISDIFSILLSLTASNVKGNTKRAVVNTMFFIGYCAGCIGAPQAWTKAPRYTEGVILSIVTWGCLFFTVCSYWWLNLRENRIRDEKEARGEASIVYEKGQDITDKMDSAFRYSS